jgi:outer membrane receptor protein involved in Fe transport
MKKSAALWIAVYLLPAIVFAQQKNGSHGALNGHRSSTGQVNGKVLDRTSNKGIGFATVGVLHAADSSVVTGVLSQENGDFAIDKLPFGKFILRINYIGYNSVYHPFSLTAGKSSQDLGNFKLSPTTSTLKTVNVTAEKPAYTMGLDKKVFDVSKSLTSVGGDATDVLKLVPSVNVDIDGNVTLRNGSPTIFVDGKRTTLTLDEIPAESIAKIEVITNPSAKYDAEGMSGIINIVLKKNRKPGLNGTLRAGGDTRGGYSAGGNMNVYRKPFNLSLSYFLHNHSRPYTGTTERHNLFDDSWLHQHNDGKRGGLFQMGRIGLDYFLDNRNTLSIEGGIGGGSFKSHEKLNSIYQGGDQALDSSSNRRTYDDHTFRFYSGDLSYKHTFKKEGHDITADLNYNRSKNGGDGNYQTLFFDNTGKPMEGQFSQTNNTNGSSSYFTGQLDYENPLSAKSRLEAGLKTSIRNSNSVYDVFDVDPDQKSIFNPYLSSDYNYDESIYAGYVQFSSQLDKFSYQLGLRGEQYEYDGSIPSKGLHFKPQKDKLGLYPSAYLTYKFSEEDQMQFNYSRRVERPRFWDRIPYTDYSDPQNLEKGNPDLKPEYTNSFELSYNKFFGQSNLMATLYFRNTNNEITDYTEPYNNSTDTLISYAINARTNNSYGGEFTLQTQLAKWWTVTANLNLFQTNISANVKSRNLSNSNFSWSGKINSQMKLPADFSVQLSGRYRAPEVTPQGHERHGGSVDVGIKKDFLEKKNLSVTLAMSDILNTRRREEFSEIPEVYSQTSIRRRPSRYLKLDISYSFGKQDLKLFKRKAGKDTEQPAQGDQGQAPEGQEF